MITKEHRLQSDFDQIFNLKYDRFHGTDIRHEIIKKRTNGTLFNYATGVSISPAYSHIPAMIRRADFLPKPVPTNEND